jgi:ribosomal protein S18 acetylase RimI-like enzyme
MLVGTYQHSQRSSLIELLVELAEYYDTPRHGNPSEVAAHLDDTIAAPGSPITLVTAASSTGRVVGLAALMVMPSILDAVGPHRLQCQLKELYVTQVDRGAGVGSALLRWSARFAIDRGCGRLDWHVKAANAAGIRFYERHGAQLVAERLSYRVDGDQLASLAATGAVS